MALTMVAGSFVAGSTPMGGGAVAYPVMVLALNVVSYEARTFALMIQSIGMSCASWRILIAQRDTIDPKTILFLILMGCTGFNIGYYLVVLPSRYVQTIYFTTTLILGVITQVYFNRFIDKDPQPFKCLCTEQLPTLIPVTILGGILVSMTGTGIDVIIYMYHRLLYKSEEHATTNYTILLMATLSLFGYYNALVINHDISQRLWKFWMCATPVVAVFAPLGNYITNRWLTRRMLNGGIYALEIFQYIAGFIITISKDVRTIALSTSMIGATAAALTTRFIFWDKRRPNAPLPLCASAA